MPCRRSLTLRNSRTVALALECAYDVAMVILGTIMVATVSLSVGMTTAIGVAIRMVMRTIMGSMAARVIMFMMRSP